MDPTSRPSSRSTCFVVIALMLALALAPLEARAESSPLESGPPNGGRLGLQLINAIPTGTFGDLVSFGIGGQGWAGYEFRFGPLGITPRLAAAYVHFFGKDVMLSGLPG